MKNYPVYIVLESPCAQKMAEMVSARMSAGYVPHGPMIYGHCCKHSTDVDNSHYYAQPMVLPESHRPEGWQEVGL